MRRFVALPVPADVRGALSQAIRPVRERYGSSLRWARPEGWHVTLAFLGEVEDATVPAVVEVVREVLAAADGDPTLPRELQLAEAGRFGRGVLWAGVRDQPDGSVAALGAAVQRGLVEAGVSVQEQPVEPHVTLARGRRRSVTDAMVQAVDVPSRSWEVRAVELWRSHLGDGPARYEVDASLPVS